MDWRDGRRGDQLRLLIAGLSGIVTYLIGGTARIRRQRELFPENRIQARKIICSGLNQPSGFSALTRRARAGVRVIGVEQLSVLALHGDRT